MWMCTHNYSERDYAFGQIMLTQRTAIGLTQRELALLLHISRRAVGEWEAGKSYPKAEHLRTFIELCLQRQAFSVGREEEEIVMLWSASHQKVLLDKQWLSTLLSQLDPARSMHVEAVEEDELPVAQFPSGVHIDWGEALALPNFYGREQELVLLAQWLAQERCRVVSIVGLGGIGKSALTVNLIHRIAEQFEVVIFRSLRDAPLCETFLDDCLQVLTPQYIPAASSSLQQRVSLLLEQLRKTRVLLVLDNLETLLEEGEVTGHFRSDVEGYELLLRRVAETEQKSSLLLTSREKPARLRALEGKHAPVRSLRLLGLDARACEYLLAEKGAIGTLQDQKHLIERYTGNPLALKIVGETVTDLFGGEISLFLKGDVMIFGSISELLAEQFARLSSLKNKVTTSGTQAT